MEAYARVLNYAIPAFLLLILIEQAFAYYRGQKVYRLYDAVSSLSSGITNVVKDVLGLSIVIISYSWMVKHFAVFSIESTPLLYVLAFVGKDFSGYWVHRWSHEINVFWNRHIIHHSSEDFNLACALRQSVSEIFALFTFTYIPMAILGIPGEVIGVVAPLHLFAQFWYHTRLIGRMGWLEHIIVTPSHHRVHHAINPEYMDRNYGQIFILWDKWFGTFQEESPDVSPVYGVSRPVQTWNPWIINYMHFWLLLKDAWYTKKWWDKLKIWFMPTGWRPADVAAKFPVNKVREVQSLVKYNTQGSDTFSIWTVCQLFITLAFMMFLFNSIGTLSVIQITLYGVFLFLMVFAYTSLMDGSVLGIVGEAVKCGLGFFLIQTNSGSWFGLDALIPDGTTIVTTYLLVSLVIAAYFYWVDKPSVVSGQQSLLPAA